jgi:1-acyl-sn-glycerol-3-phosphate acyltransferase
MRFPILSLYPRFSLFDSTLFVFSRANFNSERAREKSRDDVCVCLACVCVCVLVFVTPQNRKCVMLTKIWVVVYLFLWITVITFVVTLNLAIAPIVFLVSGRRTCTKLFTYSANIVATIMTIEFEWKVAGKKILFYGDKIPLHQTAIVICNHRSVLDWLVIFCLARRKGRLGCAKFFVKDSVKWIPGVGCGLYLVNYVFLKRNWVH